MLKSRATHAQRHSCTRSRWIKYLYYKCIFERQSKSSRNSLNSTVCCTTTSYLLDTVLLAISTCKFCTGSSSTSGRQGQCFLHHDNAPNHTSLVMQQFLSSQPPYSPDLALSDVWLFPTLKMGLKGACSQPSKISNRMQRPNLKDSKISLKPVFLIMTGPVQ
jgi:hypothetical protein